MGRGHGWAARLAVGVLLVALAGAASSALGGMAELGRQRRPLEAINSAGDGVVTIFIGANPNDAASRKTGGCMLSPQTDCTLASQTEDCGADTCVPRSVSDILDLLADDLGPNVTHDPGSPEITIPANDFGIRSTDSLLQYVKAIRDDRPGQVSLLEVTEPPVGGSTISIRVTNEDDLTREVTVLPVAGNATATNTAIRAALQLAGYELGEGPPGRIVIRRDGLLPGPSKKLKGVDWQDDDSGSGIQTIGAFSSVSQGVALIPTLSEWAMLLMMVVLGASGVLLLRRRGPLTRA